MWLYRGGTIILSYKANIIYTNLNINLDVFLLIHIRHTLKSKTWGKLVTIARAHINAAFDTSTHQSQSAPILCFYWDSSNTSIMTMGLIRGLYWLNMIELQCKSIHTSFQFFTSTMYNPAKGVHCDGENWKGKYIEFAIRMSTKSYQSLILFINVIKSLLIFYYKDTKNMKEQYCNKTICDSTYQKVPVVRRLEFELQACKVKMSHNVVPRLILRFHIIFNLLYLHSKSCLKDFHVKMDFWIAIVHQ